MSTPYYRGLLMLNCPAASCLFSSGSATGTVLFGLAGLLALLQVQWGRAHASTNML
jgi:hypothetical protein